jgi:hypothetical protein
VFCKIDEKIFIKVCVGNLTHVLCLAFLVFRNFSVLTSLSVVLVS